MIKEKKKIITASISQSLAEGIEEVVRKRGMPKSAFVRSALRDELNAGCNNPAIALVILELQEKISNLDGLVSDEEYQDLLIAMNSITELMI